MSEYPETNPDDDGSNFSIEVAPLPRSSPDYAARIFHAFQRMRTWRGVLTGCAILVALAIIFSSISPLHIPFTGWALPRPTATNTTEPTPALLAKVPANCPPGNALDTFSPAFSQGVGVARLHIWLVGFDGPTATLRFTGGVNFTAHGWPSSLMLAAAPDVTQPITLRATGMFGVTDTVWFSTNGVENGRAHARPPYALAFGAWVAVMAVLYHHPLGRLLFPRNRIWRQPDRHLLRSWDVALGPGI
jgi:hypothetical protein